jgi:hypothetical protein
MTDTMDEALQMLAPYGPDLRSGLTNHAPMATEALCRLGRSDAVLPWIERYRPGMMPRPSRIEKIGSDWKGALGRYDRTTEWMELFEEELREAHWRDVVARWANRFAPAVCASAMHGVIRVGHAVRSLGEAETPLRLRELAEALGYWAATYQTLPATSAPGEARSRPREAIARVRLVPPEERRFTGTIVSSLEALGDFPDFKPVVAILDTEADPSALISELTEVFARVLVANARDVLGAIVFVHGVTGLTAVRSLVPLVDPESATRMIRYGWQASAALYAAFGSERPAARDGDLPAGDVEALVDEAVAHGDEHAIKLTEACVREHALRPSPAYFSAARLAIELLPRA